MKNQTLFALVSVILLFLQVEILSAQPKLEFSHEHGFYKSSFQLFIKSSEQGGIIKYTLDGSDPKNSQIAKISNSPAEITIDPNIKNGRAATAGVIVRACAISNGDTSKTYTQSYIFLSEVKYQNDVSPELVPYWPGQDYLRSRYSPNLIDWMRSDYQRIYLKVDPQVVYSDEYYSGFENDLLSNPTFSLVTDPANLFNDLNNPKDTTTGIYVNASWAGIAWERAGSLELIDPSGEGFQVNTGIRIRGGVSSRGDFAKHAFRFFFREKYGNSKLEYPLYDKNGTDKFDKIDLRCDVNNSWNSNPNADYIHDAFSREMQGEMKQPYTKSRSYHLFLNGMYWGLYETEERASASFAESYMGGKKEDYDVVKSSAGAIDYPPYTLEPTDGDLNSSEALWKIAVEGFSHDNYFKAMGLNPDGSVNPAYPKYLDVDNLISYMMVIYFSSNRDGPASLSSADTRINNFFGIFNRENPDGFKYCIHDNETAYLSVNDNITNSPVVAGWTLESFNPMWLHLRLIENSDYKQRFADLAYQYLFNDGVLSAEKNIARFQKRVDMIDDAIVGESARWGHMNGGFPNTKNGTWMPAINNMLQNYFPQRTQIVIDQFKSKGWLNDLIPPVFDETQFNTSDKGILVKEDHFKLINNNTSGQIYYTTDDSDPRASGGGISENAIQYSSEIDASKTVFLKARIKSGDQWSPLTKRIILKNDGSKLIISEISYNPIAQLIGIDSLQGKDLEFIEIKNPTNSSIEMSGYEISGGISYKFAQNSTVEANGLIVIASDSEKFKKLYGFSPLGQFSGNLSNGEENITLNNPFGSTIAKIKYNKGGVWYNAADGSGYTLVTSNYLVNQLDDTKSNWRVSTNWLGSPGADDPNATDTTIVISEVLANSKKPFVDAIEFYNPNSFQVNIGNWYLSDEIDKPSKWKIPSGTIIQPKGYLSFNEGHYVSDSIQYKPSEFGNAFSLSKGGEKIYLYSANKEGTLKNFICEYEFGATDLNTSFGIFTSVSGKEHNVELKSPSFGTNNSTAKLSPIIFKTIMYHPVDQNFEFITLKNRSDSTVNLFSKEFPEITWKVDGIDFEFPKGISLAAGDSLFIVEKLLPSELFSSIMNLPARVKVFNYAGKLKNSGESVSIKKPLPVETDSTIEFNYINLEEVEFNDKSPWPKSADGGGFALVRIDDNAFGNDPSNWTAGYKAVPCAIAGNNLRVKTYMAVTLDGSGSYDPSKRPLTYNWEIVSKPAGSNSKFSNKQLVAPQFTPDVDGNYLISLKVNNGLNTSAPALISLFAKPNSAPVTVYYTRNYFIKLNQTILLGTNDSYDIDYDKINFTWELTAKPDGSILTIEDKNSKSFNFKPDLLGTYQFSLVISDGLLSAKSIIIKVFVSAPTGTEMITAINDVRVYPNPVKDEAFIDFNLKNSSNVNIRITDLKGRTILSKDYGWFEPGNQIITTQLSELSIPGGIYFINFRSKEYSINKKVYYMPGN
jgi:hypothetical protein